VLQASGLIGEVEFDHGDLLQTGTFPVTTHDWWLWWKRKSPQGVLYQRDQGASVFLRAETGEVLNMSIAITTPAPSRISFVLGREQAAAVAAAQVARLGVPPDLLLDVNPEIVQPNTFWKPGGSGEERLPYAWAAWTCVFLDEDRDARHHSTSGGRSGGRRDRRPLGGTFTQNRGGGGKGADADVSLERLLRTAREVRVYGRGGGITSGWDRRPTAVLSPSSFPRLFRSLQSASAFGKAGGGSDLLPAFKIEVLPEREATTATATAPPPPLTLFYRSSGHVGLPDRWAAAPAPFRTWMAELRPKSPPPPPPPPPLPAPPRRRSGRGQRRPAFRARKRTDKGN
jgi:hypothetical protein